MNFRRYYVPNSTIFITNVVHRRQPIFSAPQHVDLLRSILREVQRHHPFVMLGYVFLPDHFHVMFRTTGTSNFSKVMQSWKRNFTVEYKDHIGINGRMKFWQKRFWDHVIRDEHDFQNHLDYIHYNPVKHGLVERPEQWADSSYFHWKELGFYADGWGATERPSTLVRFGEEEECY